MTTNHRTSSRPDPLAELAELHETVQDLKAQVAGLEANRPEALAATRRAAKDVAARAPQLPGLLAAAWEQAEPALAAEVEALAVLDAARAARHEAATPLPIATATPVQLAERNLVEARAWEAERAAEQRWNRLRDQAGHALRAVDLLEAEIEAATGEHPAADDTGPRARPQILARSAVVDRRSFGDLGDFLAGVDGLVPHPDAGWRDTQGTLLAGVRPPRWVAHRFGPRLFRDPAIDAAEVAEQDRAAAEQRRREEDAALAHNLEHDPSRWTVSRG